MLPPLSRKRERGNGARGTMDTSNTNPDKLPFKSTFSVYCHKSVMQTARRFGREEVLAEMSGTELFATFLGSVALLLWGVRMVRTGMTRAFGAHAAARDLDLRAHAHRRLLRRRRHHRHPAKLDRDRDAARLVRGARADRAADRARGHVSAPMSARRIVAQVFSFDVKWLWTVLVALGVLAVHVDRSRQGARRRAHLHRPRLHAARAGAHRQRGGAAAGLPLFRSLLTGLAGEPVLGFLAAIAVAWLVHSSLSIVLLVMSLAAAVRCRCRSPSRWCSAPMSAARSRRSSRCRPRRRPAAACRSAIW